MVSLQERFAPDSICFGCGPKNKQGLHIKSVVSDDPGIVTASWTPMKHHHAFPGVLNGGIIGAIMDCHSNWAAAWALRESDDCRELPSTVTAWFRIDLAKPTPMDQPLTLTAQCVEKSTRKAQIKTTLMVDDTVTATCDALFVAVNQDHPASHRW